MKVLLDENLPEDLKFEFHGFEVYSVNDMKWNNKKNGELLSLIVKNGFDALITLDKNLRHQQNLNKYPIKVICLRVKDSRIETSLPLVPKVIGILSRIETINYYEVP